MSLIGRSLFCLVILLLAVSSFYAQQSRFDVSIISLIANPEKYDGKKVRISGFLHVQFEDSAIYLHKDDADHLIGENALWVDYAKDPSLQPICKEKYDASKLMTKYFNGRYVLIEGVFNMKGRGHMGAFSGTIEDVSRVLEQRKWFDGPREHTPMDKNGRVLDDCK